MYSLYRKYPATIIEAFERTIKTSHTRRVRIILRNGINGNIKEVIERLQSASVEFDMSAVPFTKMDATIYRPKTRVEPNDLWPSDTWQLVYEVYVPELDTSTYNYQNGGFVKVPMFAGFLKSVKRNEIEGSLVDISCIGFEQRYNYPLYTKPANIKPGARVSSACKQIFDHVDNYWNYDWPDPYPRGFNFKASRARISKKGFTYGSEILSEAKTGNVEIATTSLAAAYKLASACGGWSLFCDAEFQFHLHPVNRKPVVVLSEENANILKPPSVNVDFNEFFNRVVVWGAQPEKKPRIKGVATADGYFSPTTLNWDMVLESNESDVNSVKAANSLAEKKLREALAAEATVDIEGLIDPRIQPYDWMMINYADMSHVVPIRNSRIDVVGGAASQTLSSVKKDDKLARLFRKTKPKPKPKRR